MMKSQSKPRKRGRPPKGEFLDKKATLTTRITEKVRKGLDREAKRNGRSLSQEVEFRLSKSLEAPRKLEKVLGKERRNRAFAVLTALVANRLEGSTEVSWRKDPYTCEALRSGLDIVITGLSPEGEVLIPKRIAADIAKGPKVLKQFEQPEGLATAVALGLLDQLKRADRPPKDHPPDQRYADGFLLFPQLREDLEMEGTKI